MDILKRLSISTTKTYKKIKLITKTKRYIGFISMMDIFQ